MFRRNYYLTAFIITAIIILDPLYNREILTIKKELKIRAETVKGIFKKNNKKYILYISKKDFMLYVYNRDIKIEASYIVGYGYNRDKKAKLYEGDNCTPEGLYKIIGINSIDHRRNRKSYRYLKALNRRYMKVKDGYYLFDKPDRDIGRNAFGPRLFKINYPNKNDKILYKKAVKNRLIPKTKNGELAKIGFGISIHGNNYPASIGNLASSGCIMMYNHDIKKLDRYVKMGTPVFISRY